MRKLRRSVLSLFEPQTPAPLARRAAPAFDPHALRHDARLGDQRAAIDARMKIRRSVQRSR